MVSDIAQGFVPYLASFLILFAGGDVLHAVAVLRNDTGGPTSGRAHAAELPARDHAFPSTSTVIVARGAVLKLRDGQSEPLSIGQSLTVESDTGQELRVKSYGRTGVVERESVVALDQAASLFSERIEHNPNEGSWYSARGLAYRYMGRHDLAQVDYDRGLMLAPENAELWLRRGYLRRLANDGVGAISDYDQAIKRQPEFWMAILNRGHAKLHAGSDRADALQDFERVVRLAPNAARTHSALAWYWLQTGEFKKSITKSDEALRIEPAHAPALVNRATAYAGLKNFEFATRDLVAATTIDPSTVITNYSRLVEWLSSGQLESEESGSTLFFKAYHHYRRGDVELCRHHLTLAEAKLLDSGLVPLLRGLVEIQLGEFTEALPQLDLAFQRGIVWSRLFYWRGQCHRELSNFAAAEEQQTCALQLDPSIGDAWIERAMVRQSRGKLRDAAHDAAMAVVVTRESEFARLIQGRVALASGDLDSAYLDAEVAVGRSPRNGEAHLLRAYALLRMLGEDVAKIQLTTSKQPSDPLDKLTSKLRHVVTFMRTSATYQDMIAARAKSITTTINEFTRFSPPPPDLDTTSGQQIREWYQQRCRTLLRDVQIAFEVERAFSSLKSLDNVEGILRKELDRLIVGCLTEKELAIFKQHQTLQAVIRIPLVDASRDINAERLGEAMAVIEKAILSRPKDPRLLLLRGEARLATGKYELAERDFDQVLLDTPGLLSALRGRAWARIHVGNVDGAEIDLDAIVAADPMADRALQNVQHLPSRTEINRLAHEALDLTLAANVTLLGADLEFPQITDVDKYIVTIIKDYDARVDGRMRSALGQKLLAVNRLQRAWELLYDRHTTDIAGMRTLLNVHRLVLKAP